MGLTTLARLGEFVAGIGVIITLAYLGVQMRQNTLSVRANTQQGLTEAVISITNMIAASPEVSEFFHKAAMTPDGLSEVERMRWHVLMTGILRHFENAFSQQRLGTLDPAVWKGMEDSLGRWCALPGFVEWLRENRGRLSVRFEHWLIDRGALDPLDSPGAAT